MHAVAFHEATAAFVTVTAVAVTAPPVTARRWELFMKAVAVVVAALCVSTSAFRASLIVGAPALAGLVVVSVSAPALV